MYPKDAPFDVDECLAAKNAIFPQPKRPSAYSDVSLLYHIARKFIRQTRAERTCDWV